MGILFLAVGAVALAGGLLLLTSKGDDARLYGSTVVGGFGLVMGTIGLLMMLLPERTTHVLP